jgi:hypothetical protein
LVTLIFAMTEGAFSRKTALMGGME